MLLGGQKQTDNPKWLIIVNIYNRHVYQQNRKKKVGNSNKYKTHGYFLITPRVYCKNV